MASAKCRTCDCMADAGTYCSSCAADIMAKALNPYFRGQRKKLPDRSGKLSPPQPATYSSQQRLFG